MTINIQRTKKKKKKPGGTSAVELTHYDAIVQATSVESVQSFLQSVVQSSSSVSEVVQESVQSSLSVSEVQFSSTVCDRNEKVSSSTRRFIAS